LYIFYVIFDLQFILSNSQQGGGGGEEEERELSSITAAFNLLTKDIIQLIFLSNKTNGILLYNRIDLNNIV
jgi:hypothetical protein